MCICSAVSVTGHFNKYELNWIRFYKNPSIQRVLYVKLSEKGDFTTFGELKGSAGGKISVIWDFISRSRLITRNANSQIIRQRV
jgi:hypothetical protein